MLKNYNKILVTGGAGFIGSHLVEKLLYLGKEVVIFDNVSSGKIKNILKEAKLIKGDIRKPREIIKATKGVDLVFHAAANANGTVSVNNPEVDFEINAKGTLNILEAALKTKVKRFVYVSSASVYGKPQYNPMDEEHPTKPFVPYGASKYTGEIYCHVFYKTQNLSTVMARPFCVYGSRENPKTSLVEVSRYLSWHLNNKPIQIVGDVNKKIRDFVHVSDLVQGLILIADKGKTGEPYNIGSGETISMKKLVEVIGLVTGKKPKTNIISNIEEDTHSLTANISKLKSIGYKPKISLKEGVKQLVKDLGKKPELPSGETIFKKGQKGEV